MSILKRLSKALEALLEPIEVSIGDKVMWYDEDGGQLWIQEREILDILEYGGDKFAIFKESKTGIPINDRLRKQKTT